MDIREDDLTHPDVVALVKAHLTEMAGNKDAVMSHALPIKALKADDVTFFSIWEGETITGCGAVRELDSKHGELKSMHTDRHFRRRGVSAALLFHMTKLAKERGYERLSLETHPGKDYMPARKLYERFGFEYCGPFGDYEEHPYSVFMTKAV